MDRRRFLIGAGSAAIGGSALLGSGAFSRVESQRGVAINVAEDPDAYVGLDRCPDSPNQSYIEFDKGHLQVQMNPDNPNIEENGEARGTGVNSDSRTWFDRVFQICNQGKEKACVWIEDDGSWPHVTEDDSETFAGDRRVDFYVENEDSRSFVGQENAVGIEVGDCLCIGIRTNTKSLSEGAELLEDLGNEITIVADVDEDCVQAVPEDEFGAFQVDLAWGDPLGVIDSEPPLTYGTQRRLMAWQHGTSDGVASFENGARFAEYTDRNDLIGDIYAMGFGSLVDVEQMEFRDEDGELTETTEFPDPGGNVNSGAVTDGDSDETPVEAEVFFTVDLDAAEDLKDDLEKAADENILTEEERDRGLAALNDGVSMTFTSYGGDEPGWNPPEFQILFDDHTQVKDSSTHSLTVDLPPLQ